MYRQSAQDYNYTRASREVSRVNTHGDTYRKNESGQITAFMYAHSDILFTFGYDSQGVICDVESSTGWSWTKIDTPGFNGWLVRNYFERWYVSGDDCDAVYVSDFGVKAAGRRPEKMDLPERP